MLTKRLSPRLGNSSSRQTGSFTNDSRKPLLPERPGLQKENRWCQAIKNRLADGKRADSHKKDASLGQANYHTPLKPIAANTLSTQNKLAQPCSQAKQTEKKFSAQQSGFLAPTTTVKLKPCTPRPRQESLLEQGRSDSQLRGTHPSKLLNRTDDRPAGKTLDVPDDATEIEFDTHSEIEQSTPIGRKVEKSLSSTGHQHKSSLVSGKKLLLRHAALRAEKAAATEQAHNSEMSLVELNYSPSRSTIDSKIYIMNNQASVSTFGIKMNRFRTDRTGLRSHNGHLNQTLDP